ncbi:MAG TPA: TetR/AcrR family transcriptional regulator [Syntrophales bacterium]|nr:TetR/AcrR family transcriptional regulator [Syntrophales bacterium]HOL59677.1 TetR/AcrR family transcriptional regulator [Syntrophales bacterium]HPO35823.1 TetR/AcrR family transcriptional regulator [Syntrophales bacterium]
MPTPEELKLICQKRREREKGQRVQSILDAARSVFSAKGYLKATMDEIACAAEVTKPTVYLYFKTKDELFFSLMAPLIDDTYRALATVEERVANGDIDDGEALLSSLMDALYHGYESRPDTFRILQLFQQEGLVNELEPKLRDSLNEKGRQNFALCRRILSLGMEKGLLKEVNVYELADLIWGLLVGVIQLEDIKSDAKKGHKLKTRTLSLAKRILIAALVTSKKGGNDEGG